MYRQNGFEMSMSGEGYTERDHEWLNFFIELKRDHQLIHLS